MEQRTEFFAAAQVQLEELYPGSLVMDGTTYAVARGGEEWELSRERGGFADESEVMVRIRKELMQTRPVKRAAVTLDGRAYYVDDVASRAEEGVWHVALKRR